MVLKISSFELHQSLNIASVSVYIIFNVCVMNIMKQTGRGRGWGHIIPWIHPVAIYSLLYMICTQLLDFTQAIEANVYMYFDSQNISWIFLFFWSVNFETAPSQ